MEVFETKMNEHENSQKKKNSTDDSENTMNELGYRMYEFQNRMDVCNGANESENHWDDRNMKPIPLLTNDNH